MADSGDIDNALIAKLGADATLLGYMPNNVYLDEAPPGMTRFVIVSLASEDDALKFGGRSHEDALYLVKAVGRSTVASLASVKAAAARIDELLEGGALTVPGYSLMTMHRESRLTPQIEVDEVDPTIRWYHRGGYYSVVMST